jgi:hypothetical protein
VIFFLKQDPAGKLILRALSCLFSLAWPDRNNVMDRRCIAVWGQLQLFSDLAFSYNPAVLE